jgi:two-component system LytT family response regulator
MIKVLLIDDEPLARTLLKEYLQTHGDIEIAGECNDGFEGIKSIQALNPDLIFLDIQMPRLNGFEMLELVENPPYTIFTTAFDEYALKAFEANAIDYLLKPFNKERFDKALQKALVQITGKIPYTDILSDTVEAYPDSGNRIVLKTDGQILILPVSEVMYIEAYDDYVKIFTEDKHYVKKKTMAFYEKTLDKKAFVRIHRSHILNLSFITRIEQKDKDSYFAVLKNGTRLALSRSGYGLLKLQLGI